jgi:hypothetical protein
MSQVTLTLTLDDTADVDVELHVSGHDIRRAAAPATVLKPRAVPNEPGAASDDYVLGGYAGI